MTCHIEGLARMYYMFERLFERFLEHLELVILSRLVRKPFLRVYIVRHREERINHISRICRP